jgi:hypothetical protein
MAARKKQESDPDLEAGLHDQQRVSSRPRTSSIPTEQAERLGAALASGFVVRHRLSSHPEVPRQASLPELGPEVLRSSSAPRAAPETEPDRAAEEEPPLRLGLVAKARILLWRWPLLAKWGPVVIVCALSLAAFVFAVHVFSQ